METYLASLRDGVFKRVLWLYGAYSLLNGAAFLFGYYLLPEGFMRGSPQAAVGRAAATGVFWSELALTLLINVGLVALVAVVCNLSQVKGFPAGYVSIISLGIFTGLISGTNSFTASAMNQYNARDGLALGLSIGGLETLAYVLVIASTVAFGVYQYRSWWRWSGEYKPVKVMPLREVKLTRPELICLGLGLALLLFAAVRETVMAVG